MVSGRDIRCPASECRQTVPVNAVVFIHGVGGPAPDWDEPIRGQLEVSEASPIPELVTFRYDDLLCGPGWLLREDSAAAAPVAFGAGSSPADGNRRHRDQERLAFLDRRQRLAEIVAASPEAVAGPRFTPPIFALGEALVRLPALNMRQAGHYRYRPEVRESVLDRLENTLADCGDGAVVLAHSLGSVVALDALHTRDIRIGLLVTIGSPLGIGRFWAKPWDDLECFPYHRIGSWLNVVNRRDPVPWFRGVSRRFPPAVDVFVDQGSGVAGLGRVHDPVLYVGSGPVLAAIAASVAVSIT